MDQYKLEDECKKLLLNVLRDEHSGKSLNPDEYINERNLNRDLIDKIDYIRLALDGIGIESSVSAGNTKMKMGDHTARSAIFYYNLQAVVNGKLVLIKNIRYYHKKYDGLKELFSKGQFLTYALQKDFHITLGLKKKTTIIKSKDVYKTYFQNVISNTKFDDLELTSNETVKIFEDADCLVQSYKLPIKNSNIKFFDHLSTVLVIVCIILGMIFVKYLQRFDNDFLTFIVLGITVLSVGVIGKTLYEKIYANLNITVNKDYFEYTEKFLFYKYSKQYNVKEIQLIEKKDSKDLFVFTEKEILNLEKDQETLDLIKSNIDKFIVKSNR